MKSLPITSRGLTQQWRWMLPALIIALILTALIWLPLQAQRMEANERQEQLIADTLWVEQAIVFQLNRNDELLKQIGQDIISAKISNNEILNRLSTLQKNNREIAQIAWYDSDGELISSTDQANGHSLRSLSILNTNLRQAGFTKDSRCFPPFPDVEVKNAWLLQCKIPLNQAEQSVGFILLSYKLSSILDEVVPWWFAQDNQITLLDQDEKVLAERLAGGQGKNIYVHNRELELPGLTLRLRTNSIKSEPKVLSNLLVVSVIVLSCCLIGSLYLLWRDLNRRLKAEAELRQQVMFRSAMENSLITGLRARDMEGRLTYVNPAFCKIVGYPAEQLIGRLPPLPYWAPEAIPEYQNRFNQILAGTVPPEGFETTYLHANGERIRVLVYESPLITETGVQTGWMSSVMDITELKRAQELSRQQQEKLHASARLATMGEIASMLAHELNQPLAAISSYTTGALNLIESEKAHPEVLRSALQKAQAQAQRAGQIIRSVHEFVKKRDATRSPVDIHTLIHSVTPLVELQAQVTHCKLDWHIATDIPQILADRVLIEQVLLNLTRNAVEAMQHNPPGRRTLNIIASFDPDLAQVVVDVVDWGHGIPKELADHLFSPFFSTKSTGMGMGLNICRTAIEFHGGHLSFRDNPEGGTIFSFSLPVLTTSVS